MLRNKLVLEGSKKKEDEKKSKKDAALDKKIKEIDFSKTPFLSLPHDMQQRMREQNPVLDNSVREFEAIKSIAQQDERRAAKVEAGGTWVRAGESSDYVIRSKLDIDADIFTVWQVITDGQKYDSFSKGSYNINKNYFHSLDEDWPISVDVRVGNNHLHSDEFISVVDYKNKVLAWEYSPHPSGALFSERYHVLDRSPDDNKKTFSYIGYRVPKDAKGTKKTNTKNPMKFFEKNKADIQTACDDLHLGIKQEAERRMK